MQPSSSNEPEQVRLHGCCPCPCPAPFLSSQEPKQTVPKPRSTSSTSRHNFAVTTTSCFFPNTQFTNHESLPTLPESFLQFAKTYPQYLETTQVDRIRAEEYDHLSVSNHVCLDYIGIGLFSHLQLQNSMNIPIASTSSNPPQDLNYPLFGIAYKSVDLKSQLLHGGDGSELESSIKKRVMEFLNVSENDYSMVFTANRSSAFKVLAESYPFQSSRKLLTVYDHESEAVETMISTSQKRGARIMSAEFTWPRLRIHSAKLRTMVVRKRRKKKKRGLFVFPLQSRVTGGSYSYQWMSTAQENGWHVLLDACALGPKDMDSFGLSLIRPDFLICSFYKVFGENPTGFGCLFVKKSTIPVLEASSSTGIITLVPPKKIWLNEDSSGTETELEQPSRSVYRESDITKTGFLSIEMLENGESEVEVASEPELLEISENGGDNRKPEIECRCLDQVDSLGLVLTSSRTRFLINWLVNSLLKLHHPSTEEKIPLVRIYGLKVKFDRGPALAFNVYDWKGERIEPVLVQKLADRNDISLSYGCLHQIWFPDKYEEVKARLVERSKPGEKARSGNSKKAKAEHIKVVTIALGFLASFEDMYKLWAFVAQFLDADFLEKERWRYTALNQKTVEVL